MQGTRGCRKFWNDLFGFVSASQSADTNSKSISLIPYSLPSPNHVLLIPANLLSEDSSNEGDNLS